MGGASLYQAGRDLSVQVLDLYGNLHVEYQLAGVPHRLHVALLDAVVGLRDRKGVRVAPDQALTWGAEGPEIRTVDVGPYACVRAEQAEQSLLLTVDRSPGAPVLNWRTGAVCGVLDDKGQVQPVGDAGPFEKSNRANTSWLDLLESEQLVAGDWRHAGRVLRGYLAAVATADEEHDYVPIRSIAPPLSAIYLTRRAAREVAAGDEEVERISADRLTDYSGAQVVAVPGAGKSSLIRHLAADGAKAWRESGSGEFIPVPVTASALARGHTLPEALAESVARTFSLSLDRAELVELFKGEPVPGVAWLVLVDALDEVHGADDRAKVVRQIRDHRRDPAYRFLVTSRRLDPHEMAPLVGRKSSPTFVLEVFSDDDLRRFVHRYLLERGHPDPQHAAGDLLARVARTKLADLAHVPLFATMLCHLYTETGGDDVPVNQTQLYRRFTRLQVSKLHTPDAAASLRNRVSAWGSAAEDALVGFAGRVVPALEDMAYDVLVRHERADPPDAAARWLGPTPVDQETWRSAVTEVLRLSGLFVQYGSRLEYRHPTFGEYFAAARIVRDHPAPARRLLLPRRGWPWPDLQLKVFLVAQWQEQDPDVDLGPVLRPLLWWPFRGDNAGFLAELVNHGVPLPEDVERRAVRWLVNAVRKVATGEVWRRHAEWLQVLAPDRARALFDELAKDPDRSEEQRFPALRLLVEVAPKAAVEAVHAYVTTRGISPRGRLATGRLLYQADRQAGLALCTRLGKSDGGDDRLLAMQLIGAHEPEHALAIARRVVSGALSTDEQRIAAAREAAQWDHSRAMDLMCLTIRKVSSTEARTRAMEHVRAVDPDQLAVLLDGFREDPRTDPDLRFEATCFLIDRLGRPTSLLTDLAAGRGFPVRLRVKAARRSPDRAVATAILKDSVDSLHPDDDELLPVVEELLRFDAHAAAGHLAALVRNERQKPDARLQAVTLINRHVSQDELARLYRVLVDSAQLGEENRLTAAKRALAIGAEGVVTTFGRASATPVRLRMEVGAELKRKNRAQAGYQVYESVAVDGAVPGGIRVRAVLLARRIKGTLGTELAKRLVRDGLGGHFCLRLAKELDRKATIWVHEQLVARESEAATFRLGVAKLLVGLDRVAGERALAQLAEDRSLPAWVRKEAREATA